MNVIIRTAEPCDAPIIAKAEQEIAQEPCLFCSAPSELSEQSVKNFIESSCRVYLVAECNRCIAGHAFLEVLPLQSLKHIAQLNIAVHKGFQNRGIGTQLMERIIEWAMESGSIEKIELNVRASNAQAIALYRKMGFWEEGCLKRRVKTETGYIDDILMALHREFIEETGMNFGSMNQISNFSVVTDVPRLNGKPAYAFHQIGLAHCQT